MSKRIKIESLVNHEEETAHCIVAGRLIQQSAATLTLEDESDRRTFGYNNQNPDLSRVRVGDILELKLEFNHKSWRVTEQKVLVPCMLEGQKHKQWMQRWFRQSDKIRKNLALRSDLKKSLRNYFTRHGFLEVETPTLVPCPGMEPNLYGFKSIWNGPENTFRSECYLPTSPEFHLKRMLSLGYEKIFEFAKSFRNGELSPHHQPEFTMLEWYRAYECYEKLMEDIEYMVCRAAKEVLATSTLCYKGRNINLDPPWERISVKDLFFDRMGINLDRIKTGSEFAIEAHNNGYTYVKEDESFDDIYFKLFLTEVELKLGWQKPVILYDYPAEMAALSRIKQSNPRYCERFEVYIAGVELANAFGELNNANEQNRRFQSFGEESRRERGFSYPLDEGFIDALRFGMPPSTGIALGFDRLAMLFAGEESLDYVNAFPHKAPFNEEED